MSMRFNTPVFRPQDNKGRTLPGAQLFFYENYSTTPKTTYANVALTNPNPHPIIADGAGKFTDIFLGIGDYRVILTDRKGQILWDRNDVSVNDLTDDVINDIERQLAEVLNLYRMQNLGEYGVADPDLEKTFTEPNAQYVVYNNQAYWTVSGTPLPYTTDSVTYPNAQDDPNLTLTPQVTFNYVDTGDQDRQKETTGISEITIINGGDDLFPLIGQGIRTAGDGLWVVPSVTADGSPLPSPAILDATPLSSKVTVNGGTDVNLDSLTKLNITTVMSARLISLYAGVSVKTAGYRNIFDKGGANYVVLLPSEYDGTPDEIIDFTLPNGNVLAFSDTSLNLTQAGGYDDNVTDSIFAITAFNAYSAKLLSAVDDSEPGRFGLTSSGIKLTFIGKYKFSNELVVYPGIDYILPNGSTLSALTSGQTVVRSCTQSEYNAATSPASYFDLKGLSFVGGGTIDGNYIGSIGFLGDTLAAQSKLDFTVSRFTQSRWNTTATGSQGSDQLTLASISNVKELDTLKFNPNDDDGEFYVILSILGNVVTLDRDLQSNVAAVQVSHMAVGASYHMCQQSQFNVNAVFCNVGEIFSKNRMGFLSTDMSLFGMNHRSNWGMVIAGGGGFDMLGKTIQQNFQKEWVICSAIGGAYIAPYVESMNDANADTLIPPTGGSPVTAAGLRTRPMVEVKIGVSGVSINDIRYPQNSSETQFRRFLLNKGLNTIIDGMALSSDVMNENPSNPGEFAIFEQSSTDGQIYIRDFRGPTNISSVDKILVVDESGNVPQPSRASWSVMYNSRPYEVVANKIHYTNNNAERIDEYRRKSENFSEFAVGSGGIFVGDGSANPVKALGFGAGAMMASINMSMPNGAGQFFRIQQPNGTYSYLFVDNNGRLRISTSEPADRNNDGTIVGTQA